MKEMIRRLMMLLAIPILMMLFALFGLLSPIALILWIITGEWYGTFAIEIIDKFVDFIYGN